MVKTINRKAANILLFFSSLFVGAFLIYSAYTKYRSIPDVERFEYTIVAMAHIQWYVASWLSRFLIALETSLGILIALHLYGKGKWVLKLAIGLLLVFSVYLVYIWISAGNDQNCGCFGDSIWMSPSASLIKNAVLLVLLLLIFKYYKQAPLKWKNIFAIVISIATVSLVFMLLPLPGNQPHWLKTKEKLDLSSLYAPGENPPLSSDLTKGKYIIAFFSPTCPHCQVAAYKMHIMKEQDTTLPFFMVIGGLKMSLGDFWDKTKAQNIPYCRMPANDFLKITHYKWPVIDWVENDSVVAQSSYVNLNQTAIEKWLKTK